ncbi:amino acid adenylation domain-containing protein [Bordetella bronchialis]|uniref:amino acid adenylation domain-containing protein n=1 Tax=Bordetella bronchialis TaxID=463025 RepID=UPI003CFBCDFE
MSDSRDVDLLRALLAEDEGDTAGPAAAQGDEGDPLPPAQADAQGWTRMSPAQRQLWFLHRYAPSSTAYNLPRAFLLRGPLDADALRHAFDAVARRHAILRTRFGEVDGVPMQRVDPAGRCDFASHDFSSLPAADRDAQRDACLAALAQHRFDLEGGFPLVACLIRLDTETHVLAWCLHHIASDAWSNPVFARDLARAYAAARDGQEALPGLRRQYADYAAWQDERAARGAWTGAVDYWDRHLGRDVPALALPADHARPADIGFAGAAHYFDVPSALSRSLRAYCASARCTPFVVLFAAWQVLLARYAGQRCFAIGVPSAGRMLPACQDMVGFFVQTQVFKADIDPSSTLEQVCRKVRDDARAAMDHADLPLDLLLERRQLARDGGPHPLFQAMFGLQATDGAPELVLKDLAATRLRLPERAAKFELSLDFLLDEARWNDASGQALLARLEYNTALFGETTARRLAARFLVVLGEMVERPALRVDHLDIVLPEEAALLRRWSQGGPALTPLPPVHVAVAEQARIRPGAVALEADGAVLTYADVDGRANALAHRLAALGAGPDVPVAIMLERSVEMVVGLLAILKAGAAYVPLDPDYPVDRLAYMLQDCGSRLLLRRGEAPRGLRVPPGITGIDLAREAAGTCPRAPAVRLHDDNLAYIIYTSGSTGRPKGAGNRHGSLANRIAWMQREYGLTADDAVLQKTPFGFDVSVWEFFWPLTAGARLVMAAPGEHRDPARLADRIARHGVTTLHFVPSMLQAFLADGQAGQCRTLRRVLCSGEALPGDARDTVRREMPWVALNNLYGPTEAAIDVTHWTCGASDNGGVPIGRPIAGLRTWILDASLNPVPPGVPGELYLGGAGLARGYAGRAGLTADRFVADPHGPPGARLYRTGDLAAWRADGQIVYHGRTDHQIKIRGLRVELGEVEACLLMHPDVAAAVAVAHAGHAATRLVAYVTPAARRAPDVGALREALAARLPDYMVPAAIVVLPSLPLNANGKLDRKALPAPEFAGAASYEPPMGELETLLAAVWGQVLGVPRVGRLDNFFELGGDSILGLKVVAGLRKAGWSITPRDVMERQTVAALAAMAHPLAKVAGTLAASGEAALSPIQRWFFDTPMPARDRWNQSVLLRPTATVDLAALRVAMQAVMLHHDAFRLRYVRQADGAWAQRYAAQGTPPPGLECVDLSGAADATRAIHDAGERIQQGLDLRAGPVTRAAWLDLGGERGGRLLWVAHHLVVDAVSWQILLDDLHTAYEQARGGQPPRLPATGASYGAWTDALAAYRQRAATQAQRDIWRGLCGPAEPPLPARDPNGCNTVRTARTVQAVLDRDASEALLAAAARSHRAHAHEALLAGLALALCEWTGRDSVLVEVEGHGREDVVADLDVTRTVGWFTALYPVRLAPGAGDAAAALAAVKTQLRGIPDKGLGYGALRAAGMLNGVAAPQVTFNYLGRLDGTLHGWTWAEESAGSDRDPDSPRRTWLDVGVSVRDGALHVAWTYSAAIFDDASIETLAGRYLARLRDLARACGQAAAGALQASDFPLAGLDQAQLDGLALDAAKVADIYPPTPLQHGLLLHTLMKPRSGMYLMQDRYRFALRIDADAMLAAWRLLGRRHEALRAGFAWRGGAAPMQIIHHDVGAPVEVLDWRGMEAADGAARMQATLADELAAGYDMSRAPLWRVRLFRLADADRMVLSYHHILMDAWCRSLLLADFFRAYKAFRDGDAPRLPATRPYRDFIAWLARRDKEAARGYWRQVLAGYAALTPLPMPGPAGASASVDAVEAVDAVLRLTADDTAALQKAAQRAQLTLNTYVQGAWALLLARCAGVEDVLFGVTVAGRPADLDGVHDTVGLFINTLPLRVAVPSGARAAAWLRDVQAANAAMREHEHLSLPEIQSLAADLPRGTNLFDTLFVFENAPLDSAMLADAEQLGLSADGARTHTNYALTAVAKPGARLGLQITYDPGRYGAAAMQRLLQCWGHIALGLAMRPDAVLGDIALLPGMESRRLLALGQGAEPASPLDAGYAPLFEQAARHYPERMAVRAPDACLSYDALNRRADRHAQVLAAHGVGRDRVVAILAERGAGMLASVLAAFKLNAAYLGLDPSLPPRRIAQVLELAGVRVLAVSAQAAAMLGDAGLAMLPASIRIVHEEAFQREEPGAHTGRARAAPHPDQAAYVIFTSGSTGEPKGVVVTSRGMLNNQLSKVPYLGLGPEDVIAQTASQSFDISVWQLLAGLLCGACVRIVPDAVARDPAALLRQVREDGITVLECVPTLIQGMLLQDPVDLPRLRWLLPTGEATPMALARAWQRRYPGVALVNAYGPAECADDVALYRMPAVADDAGAGSVLAIGSPTDHTRLYVLDDSLSPLPAGVVGELCVAGVGVGRGYLHRAAATAERYVADPLTAVPGARMYRTGDLARFREDGVLEYAGRADHQVKVHGFRIELGEIDAQLARLPSVRQAVVAARDDGQGGRRLVAYVVAREPGATATQSARDRWLGDLRASLALALPAYMVPGLWMALDALPLSANGKIDRKALPAPAPRDTGGGHVEPAGEQERRLAEIWSQVLGVPRVGRHDSFFELGGHSLMVMQVVARIQRELHVDVPLTALFEAQTLAAFAARVDGASAAAADHDQALRRMDDFLDTLEAM